LFFLPRSAYPGVVSEMWQRLGISCRSGLGARMVRSIPTGGEPMASIGWERNFPGAITICDPAGVILEMNDSAALAFAGRWRN
jgi:hypothetical protein